MAAVTITSKPKLGVKSLSAPARQRNSRIMKATWSVPAELKKDSNKARAQGLEITWSLGLAGKDPKKVIETGNESKTSSQINLNSLKIGKKTYTRSSFYPLAKKKLSYVSVAVRATNSKGAGPKVTETREFKKPRKPTIDAISFNTETGVASTTIRTNAGEDYNERYDTRYTVKIENTRTGNTWNSSDSSSTSTQFTVSYNVTDYQQLSYDEYIKITVTAYARGFAGDSGKATRTFYVSYPAQTTIKDVDVSANDMTGKCTVFINTNTKDNPQHPVDRVKLEYLANCEYKTASQIPGDAGWTTSNIIDDGNCNALAVSVSDLLPEAGNYTWVRIKSYHADESVLYRYSDPVRVEALETPERTAADDYIKILSAVAGASGNTIIVTLGWNEEGTDDSTGTELSWSDQEDTWRSTEDPETYTFTWSDGEITHDQITYQDSAEITIKGLEEGTNYFIRARRYLEGDVTTYSPYSNPETCITSQAPESIVAVCDRYLAEGDSLSVKWTFSGYSLQKTWQIVTDDGTVLASGDNSINSTQLSYNRLLAFAEGNEVTFTVQVSTGSDYVVSEEHTVSLVERPTLSVSPLSTLESQTPPLSFTATASSLCDLIVIITSQGASGQFPDGVLRQASGDTIHSNVYSPTWTESNSVFTTTVDMPSDLDFWDLGLYTLSVTAVDRTSGLRTDPVLVDFDVEWTNQAVDPTEAITLTVLHTVDSDGFQRRAVQIDLTPPQDSNETDVYDIYRMEGQTPTLIGESFPLTYTAVDEYAPFSNEGDLFYRIALRTADGDVEFADIPYTAECDNMRLDWAGGYIELPYGLTYGDTYKKDVDLRQHMNGKIEGYWNNAIRRSSSLSSDVIRIVQPEDINKVRLLARYTGAVFVRLPNGAAFEADVQVNDLSRKNEAVSHVAFDASEINLTQEFSLPVPFELEEEE